MPRSGPARWLKPRWLKPLWLPALLVLGSSLAVLACAGAAPAGDSVTTAARKQHCSARHTAFSVGQWPSACWRPYSRRSPFNRRIPAHPALYPGSSDIVRRLVSFGRPNALRAGVADTDTDFYHPTYYARRSDPSTRSAAARARLRTQSTGSRSGFRPALVRPRARTTT